ncbi:MAG: GldG family protein [Planctomycetes bacterium]|nr:GldG family protein [Planctomycetota bacterium]
MNEDTLIIFFFAYFAHILITLYFAYYKKHELYFGLSLGFLPILGPVILYFTESTRLLHGSGKERFTAKYNFWIFGLQILLVIGVSVIFLMFFERGASRIDLTKDKRYSLDDTTKNLLNELVKTNKQFKVTYYFSPTELRPRRLQLMPKEIEDLLKEFREVAPRNFLFEMIEVPQKNLKESGEEEEKKEGLGSLREKEDKDKKELSKDASEEEKAAFEIRKFLKEESIDDIKELTYEGDKKTYQAFYSAFYVTYGSKKPIKFDKVYISEEKQKSGASIYAQANVLLTKSLRQLITEPIVVGYLIGHDEKHFGDDPTQLLRKRLRDDEGFENKPVDLKHGSIPVPVEIDILVMIATPEVLGEREQFQIDQFIMRGGKILFITSPLIPPASTQMRQFMPVWSNGDESWTKFINKYGFLVETDEVVFDEECFVAEGQSGDIAFRFAPNISGDRLTRHPACAGIKEVYLLYNNVIKQNPETLHPEAEFNPIYNSSNKAWSVTLDMTIRQDPLNQLNSGTLTNLMNNPPIKRDIFTLAASIDGKFKSQFNQGKTPKFVDQEGNILSAPAYEEKRKNEPVLSTSSDTRIIVSGNSIGYLLLSGSWDTEKTIVKMINYLAYGADYLKIEQKTATFSPLKPASIDEKTLIRFIAIGAMPILLIVLGFFLLIYRIQSRYYDQAVFELRKKRKFKVDSDKNE